MTMKKAKSESDDLVSSGKIRSFFSPILSKAATRPGSFTHLRIIAFLLNTFTEPRLYYGQMFLIIGM